MITNDDAAIEVLNGLTRACTDAERAFLRAADRVPEPELVDLFAQFALQRAEFAVQLRERVKTLRGTPESAGTVAGALHRAWMGLEAALASNEIHAILAECERGEDMSVKAYGTALKENELDDQTRRLIQTQYEAVQAAHDRIRQLRDSSTYAHR